MNNTPAQLRLAADILETGHPFEFGSGTTWNRAFDSTPFDCLKGGYQIRPVLATPPDNRPLHNPDNLTAEQVGVGYRLTVEGEPPHEDAKVWLRYYGKWCDRESTGPYIKHHAYRLPLSVPWPESADPCAELKAAHAAGKVIQLSDSGSWHDLPDPTWGEPVDEYRIKPEPAFQLPPCAPGMRWHREDAWKSDDLPSGYRPFYLGEVSVTPDHSNVTDQVGNGAGWGTLSGGEIATRNCCLLRTTRPLTFEHAGKTWTYHRPGDPMPCDGERKAYIMYQDQQTALMATAATAGWARNENRPSDIIGWRYANEKKTVKFGPEDVPPGSSFRPKRWGMTGHERIEVVQVCTTDVRLGTYRSYDFEELEASWLVNRSIPLTGKWNPNSWEPCSKEVAV